MSQALLKNHNFNIGMICVQRLALPPSAETCDFRLRLPDKLSLLISGTTEHTFWCVSINDLTPSLSEVLGDHFNLDI